MPHEAELIAKAQAALGSDHAVVAAGVFGLQDNYAAIAAGGLVASSAADELHGGAVTGALAAGAAVHVTREVMAEREGVTVRMLVAVTETSIHLFALGQTGSDPKHELMRFERATTRCEESKFGASRHLKLTDSATGQELGLTGATGFLSSYAEGDKAVLAALGAPPSR